MLLFGQLCVCGAQTRQKEMNFLTLLKRNNLQVSATSAVVPFQHTTTTTATCLAVNRSDGFINKASCWPIHAVAGKGEPYRPKCSLKTLLLIIWNFILQNLRLTKWKINTTHSALQEIEQNPLRTRYVWFGGKALTTYSFNVVSVTRLGDLLDFGQLFKAFGNN